MTQAKVKFPTFESYLSWSNDPGNFMQGRFELIDGELFEVPPEAEPNNWIARCLMFSLAMSGEISPRLVVTHSLELQVPVLRAKDSANRYPDLVVLQPEHLLLTQKRLTITLEMLPPQMVVEVMSPGKQNRERDLIFKRDQYAARGIPEYWLINPEHQSVTVLKLQDDAYVEVGSFQGLDTLISPAFPTLRLTAKQIFQDKLEN
jgi:Uma2 family endonuclease